VNRRNFLELVALTPVAACGDSAGGSPDAATTADAARDAAPGTCTRIPAETPGPYPGDGTNGANALAIAGIVRSDIRTSIGGANGVAQGVPLTVTLTLVRSADCTPLAGHAIYIWQCDRQSDYSMYTGAATAQNYLRGVQETDANGRCTFTSIFPACYTGRWPHIHFEVFASLAAATSGGAKLVVSQLAFPKAPCDAVYATAGYEASVAKLAGVSLATDGVFRDGSAEQLATVTGDVASGFVATLTIAVA
jgi:protocatechuate 3,4-dioxygenase beta subunit